MSSPGGLPTAGWSELVGYPVADVVAYLRGSWTVDREIDARDGGVGTFRGTAEFAPDGDVWSWVEAGELQWSAQTHQAGRRLLVAVRPEMPCIVDVSFDDGRFFHRADLSWGSDTFVHGCAPDTYSGTWTVVSPDHFTLRWDVDGPAKQLTIRSEYRRA